jgi:tetratricopeptide (TPR) repeat protein
MARGKYDGEGDFRKSIKDREGQEKLQAQADVVKTEDYRIKAVEDARKKIAQDSDLQANIFELADALSALETDKDENDAISLLENTYKTRNDFSFKRQAGLLRIKQLKRKIRETKAALKANSDDMDFKTALEQLSAQLKSTELEHYGLCVQNYPTDLGVKYEYALRLVMNEQYNEALPLFQEAKKDPRRKIAALNKIGFCFSIKGWLADAIDVFSQAIDSHEIKNDAIGKELRYNLARTHEQQGDTDMALEIYRKIAQSDFVYKDVSQRVDKLRSEKTKPNSE